VERIADAFVWPMRDPQWVSKVVIIALLLLIPIVGALNGLGWMLACLDRLRAGEETLPAANLTYLGRGLRLFVVNIVYLAVFVLVVLAIFVPGVVLLATEGRRAGPNVPAASLGLALVMLTFSLVTLGSVAFYFAMPSIVVEVEHGGVGAGLNVARVVRRSRATLNSTLIAGLMLIAAAFVGQVGAFACIVGAIFTTAYSLAMQAWIFRSFELGVTSPTSA
jgi:hypothetical protein